MTIGIYQIIHRASGRRYVGQAQNIEARWSQHRRHLDAGKHHSKFLQRCWTKYGAEAFEFSVIEVCYLSDLDVAEQRHLDQLPAFNTSPTAGSARGVKHTAETRAKVSAAIKGLVKTPEHLAKIQAALLRPEVRAKISAAHRGRKASDEARANMSKASKARTLSPESRAQQAATIRGRKLTLEHKAAISASLKIALATP